MSATALLERRTIEVDKARGRPKKVDRDDTTVRMERRLVTMARSIADYEGKSIVDVLSELTTTPIEAAYFKMLRARDSKG